MDRLSSSLLYMTIIAITTMAGLCASYLDYVQQRVYIVIIFIGISLAAGLMAGLALGLVRAKSRKVATTAFVLYMLAAIIASSVMFLNNTYIPQCKRRAIEIFRNTKDIALYDKWCLNEADRSAFLQIAEAGLDENVFEALLEKGLAHENPDCARLKFAIYDEDIDRVKAMVENGVDPNCTSAGIGPVVVVSMLRNKPGANPGSQALLYEILELQQPLPKVTLQDIKGAITSHNYSALKELVKHFDVNIGDTRLINRYSVKDVDNPLALAILLADPESVLTLLEAGADTRQKVYHTVTSSGKEEIREGTLYELALGMYEINKNTQAGSLYTRIVNDMTRFHVFTEAEQKTTGQFMARQRAEEERQDRENEARLSAKYSPFYDAIKAGDLGTVKQFIENKKIDINYAEFESGYSTPLMTAVLANKIEIVDYLLRKNADVSFFTTDGEDALQCASGRGYLDIVRLLVAHGANINENVDTEGRGPLVHAIRSGKVDVVKFLLSKGADLNAAQERASSLLYFAVESNNLAMVRFLVDSGLDVNAKHKYGKTPLDLAVRHKNQDIGSYLKAKGAKLSSQFPTR